MSSNAIRVGEAQPPTSSRMVSLSVQADLGSGVDEEAGWTPATFPNVVPLQYQKDAAQCGCLSWPGVERVHYTTGRIFRLAFAVIHYENKIKWNRLFAERKTSPSREQLGLESQQLRSQMLPTAWGCCWPLVPIPLRSLVALPTKNQNFPRIRGNIYLLMNWKITVKSYFAGTAVRLPPSAPYIPHWLAEWGSGVPYGVQMLVQKVHSQNGIISLADQSAVCFLLGFPWGGGKSSAKSPPIPLSWCWGNTRYLKQ